VSSLGLLVYPAQAYKDLKGFQVISLIAWLSTKSSSLRVLEVHAYLDESCDESLLEVGSNLRWLELHAGWRVCADQPVLQMK
jgi:hypothetical protein